MSVVSGEGKRAGSERRALGKGLDSLLPRVAPPTAIEIASSGSEAGKPLEIAVSEIDRNPFQTRMHFDEALLEELAGSITANGVIQPILVRSLPNGRFQLIAGERRWLASQRAGKATIPAILRQVSDETALEFTIVENLQREDLNPMEQARAYERLSREFGMTQEQMAYRTGKDRATVGNYMRLLKLSVGVQEKIATNEITLSHAKVLLALPLEDVERAVRQILSLSLNVRQTQKFVQNWMNPGWDSKRDASAAPTPVDPNVLDAQDRLQRALGLRVKIEDNKGRGRVIIEYSRLEDFDAVMEAFGGKL